MMSISKCVFCCFAVFSLFYTNGRCAYGQRRDAEFELRFDGPGVDRGAQVAKRPYFAVATNRITSTDPLGRPTLLEYAEKVYRDAFGRVRTERPTVPQSEATIIEINDPVSGFHYVLDEVRKVAHRVTIRPLSGASLAAVPEARFDRSSGTFSEEPLGSAVIAEARAIGKRETFRGRNGEVRILEQWTTADDLKLDVILLSTRTVNGVTTESTRRVTSFKREDPDVELFRVPAGYAVIDEAANFTIRYSRK